MPRPTPSPKKKPARLPLGRRSSCRIAAYATVSSCAFEREPPYGLAALVGSWMRFSGAEKVCLILGSSAKEREVVSTIGSGCGCPPTRWRGWYSEKSSSFSSSFWSVSCWSCCWSSADADAADPSAAATAAAKRAATSAAGTVDTLEACAFCLSLSRSVAHGGVPSQTQCALQSLQLVHASSQSQQ